MLLATLGACAPADPEALARKADTAHATSVFTWLAAHDPSALIAWRVAPDEVRAIIPDSLVSAASAHPCAQAKAAHAVLLLVAKSGGPERVSAESCGFPLVRDAGAVVIAPL